MQFRKIHNKGQAQLFSNKVLEQFSRSHPLVIWSMYVPVIITMVYYSSVSIHLSLTSILVTFIGGMLTWTLFEYVMHRFIFHFIAESNLAQKILYIIHGNHHEYPRDKERLFMPALPSLLLAFTIFMLMYAVSSGLGVKEYVTSFFPGFLLGYLLYGSLHYAIHAWKPPFKWMKSLWRNHHLHHYTDDRKGYGVSTTLWDRLFGTMFDVSQEKEKTHSK